MNFTGSNKELLLIYADMPHQSLSHSVNVMLTPQYYTLKKEELPVKYLYKAKKIAPSLFDGLLESEKSYEYLVYKENESWMFIAYDPLEIEELLLSKGVKPEQVSKVFFAQQALNAFKAPVLLGEKEALVAMDNTVTVVPRSALSEEVRTLMFNNDFTPKKGVSLQGGHSALFSKKQAISLGLIFAFFAGMFFIEGSRYAKGSTAEQQQMQELMDTHPSLQSKMQRESIADKYKKIDTKERKKRDTVKALSRLIFKGVTLTSLHVDEKKFNAQFDCKDENVAKRLMQSAKKENFKKIKSIEKSTVQIEGAI